MAYLQCKITKMVAAGHCDCEQILNDSGDGHTDTAKPPVKILAPDELFVAERTICVRCSFVENPVKPTAFILSFHAQLYLEELIRPPRYSA